MSNLNKVMLIGRCGREPEIRYSPSGGAICNLSLATTETWKDKATGEKKEATEWSRVVFFDRLAEIVGEYVKKGSLIYVEGKLTTRKWADKDGVEKYTTEIRAQSMQLLGGRPQQDEQQQPESRPAQQQRPQQSSSPADPFDDETIPFANPLRGRLSYVV